MHTYMYTIATMPAASWASERKIAEHHEYLASLSKNACIENSNQSGGDSDSWTEEQQDPAFHEHIKCGRLIKRRVTAADRLVGMNHFSHITSQWQAS